MRIYQVEENLMRPVVSGVVTFRAIPIHVGKSLIVVQTDVTRDDGKLIACTTQTQAVISES